MNYPRLSLRIASTLPSVCSLIPLVRVNVHNDGFNEHNGLHLVESYDVVVDCTDNVGTRYLINDACAIHSIPLVSASALRFQGQVPYACADYTQFYRL